MLNEEDQQNIDAVLHVERTIFDLVRGRRNAHAADPIVRLLGRIRDESGDESWGLMRLPLPGALSRRAPQYRMVAKELITAFGAQRHASLDFDIIGSDTVPLRARLNKGLRKKLRRLSASEVNAINLSIEQFLVQMLLANP